MRTPLKIFTFSLGLIFFCFTGSCQTAQEYFTKGLIEFVGEDIRGAIADYTKTIEIDPKFKEAYNSRGQAKCYLGDYTGAIIDFNHAI